MQTKDSIERVQRLTQVWGGALVGYISVLFISFSFLSFPPLSQLVSVLSLNWHMSTRMKDSRGGGELSHQAGPPRGEGGI